MLCEKICTTPPMVPAAHVSPLGWNATERTASVLKLELGMRRTCAGSSIILARATTFLGFSGSTSQMRSVPSSDPVRILGNVGWTARPHTSPLPCASTTSRASSEISQISPHLVPQSTLDLTSVVMELTAAGRPDSADVSWMRCNGVTSEAFQNATTPSSPPEKRTLESCRQKTALTLPLWPGTTFTSFISGSKT